MKCCAALLIPFLTCYMAAGSLCVMEKEIQGWIQVVQLWAEKADGEGDPTAGVRWFPGWGQGAEGSRTHWSQQTASCMEQPLARVGNSLWSTGKGVTPVSLMSWDGTKHLCLGCVLISKKRFSEDTDWDCLQLASCQHFAARRPWHERQKCETSCREEKLIPGPHAVKPKEKLMPWTGYLELRPDTENKVDVY